MAERISAKRKNNDHELVGEQAQAGDSNHNHEGLLGPAITILHGVTEFLEQSHMPGGKLANRLAPAEVFVSAGKLNRSFDPGNMNAENTLGTVAGTAGIVGGMIGTGALLVSLLPALGVIGPALGAVGAVSGALAMGLELGELANHHLIPDEKEMDEILSKLGVKLDDSALQNLLGKEDENKNNLPGSADPLRMMQQKQNENYRPRIYSPMR